LTRFIQLATDKDALDINCTDAKDGASTPLILLFLYNHSDSLDHCVEIILQRPDLEVNKTDKYGLNALMSLCQHSKSTKIVEIVKLLIEKGANVNQTNKYGMNVLMWLCWHSQSDKIAQVAQLLIENGIDVKKTDKNGMNALMRLCHTSGSDKIVQVGQILIANGVDLKQSEEDGMSALMLLCAKSESDKIVEMAQLLISNDIDVTKQLDKQGRNAEDHLTSRPFYSISELNRSTILELFQHTAVASIIP
jgi:ankyrin repeat protein